MNEEFPLPMHNGQSAAAADVPVVAVAEFRNAIIDAVKGGARVASLFAQPQPKDAVRLFAVLAQDHAGTLAVLAADAADSYPAITPDCPQAHWFEREIAEQWGVRPEGHPWLKPIRFHASCSRRDAWGREAGAAIAPSVTDFFTIHGEEIHEVAVGPVHAGIIEPGHFRFQCHGENVFHLEISLGYQHRGIERQLPGGPAARTIHYMETLAGDTTIGHATAYCGIVEALAGVSVPARAQVLRGVALELERIANHVGDLGALAGDVGYLPTQSYCGRIRGDFLNMTALICGNRFGRGMVRPGGVAHDVDNSRAAELVKRLDAAEKDLHVAVNLLWNTPSVMNRFEETGTICGGLAHQIGLVGPAARACGVDRDVRHDLACGIFMFAHIPVSTWNTGDVFARAYVRWLEIQQSIEFIREQVGSLPGGPVKAAPAALAPERLGVSMVEGWRGEICHAAMTDAEGRFCWYKIVDPSFHNWFGLACSLRNQQISDFPLCNKSFNLSYCGHDL